MKDGLFYNKNKAYYYVGANFWYGSVLGSTTPAGNRTRLLKELDFLASKGMTNLRIMVGSEGKMGSEGSMELYERLHSIPDVDYLTIHIWPKNWRWIDKKNLDSTLNTAIKNTEEYIDNHLAIAKKLGKPLVIEEFGFPRDGHSFSPQSTTTNRDKYYGAIFQKIQESSGNAGNLAGCNFWSYGGFGRPGTANAPWFSQNDDFLGDPPCEEQGLNTVFKTDSIMGIIRKYNQDFQNL